MDKRLQRFHISDLDLPLGSTTDDGEYSMGNTRRTAVFRDVRVKIPEPIKKNLPYRLFGLMNIDLRSKETMDEFDRLLRIFANMDSDAFESVLQDYYTIIIDDEAQQRVTENLFYLLYEAGQIDFIAEYIKKWAATYPDEAELPIISRIFSYDIQEDILETVMQIVDPEYYDIVVGLMEIPNQQRVAMGIRNLIAMYPIDDDRIHFYTAQAVKNKAINKKNEMMIEYTTLMVKVRQTNVAPIPSWVIKPDHLMTHESLVESVQMPEFDVEVRKMSYEDIANVYINLKYGCDGCHAKEDEEEEKGQLLKGMKKAERVDVNESMTDAFRNIYCSAFKELKELFRVFGPCHPFPEGYDLFVESEDPCEMWGGCRMYHCYENENVNPDTGEDLYEDPADNGLLDKITWWEKGICENEECLLKISKRCYAVRMPLLSGGWKGYYCSWKCAREDTKPSETLVRELIDGFEASCEEVGIYDRIE